MNEESISIEQHEVVVAVAKVRARRGAILKIIGMLERELEGITEMELPEPEPCRRNLLSDPINLICSDCGHTPLVHLGWNTVDACVLCVLEQTIARSAR